MLGRFGPVWRGYCRLMGFESANIVDFPRADVFEWFTRPGALTRLAPPWQPVRVVREAGSLKDGRAELALPGNLRWVARHDPAAYDPPHRFADELVAEGPASAFAHVVRWRHTHGFEAVDAGRTRIVDEVDTPVPAALLRPMFEYRHRQLAGDLAAHARAAENGLRSSTIAITGASGLVGTALTAFLRTGGHRVIRLVRGPARERDERQWDPAAPAADLLDGVDALIHLAGAPIAGRFTDEHKRRVRDSRVEPTRALAELAARTGLPTFVGASAIGYYGYDCGDRLLTEDSPAGDGYLAEVVSAWEDADRPAREAGVRVVRVRTGLVQSPAGGLLRLLRPLFSAGLGGPIAGGRQWMSWIGIDDMIDIYHRALWDAALSGPANAVAPHPVRNAEYTRTLARVVRRPAILPVPQAGPALLLGGQGARELAAASQRVEPSRLLATGHHFRTDRLEPALRHVLGRLEAPGE